MGRDVIGWEGEREKKMAGPNIFLPCPLKLYLSNLERKNDKKMSSFLLFWKKITLGQHQLSFLFFSFFLFLNLFLLSFFLFIFFCLFLLLSHLFLSLSFGSSISFLISCGFFNFFLLSSRFLNFFF